MSVVQNGQQTTSFKINNNKKKDYARLTDVNMKTSVFIDDY